MTKVSQGLPKGAESAGRSKNIGICIALKNLLMRMKMKMRVRLRMKMMKTMLTLIVSQSFYQLVF